VQINPEAVTSGSLVADGFDPWVLLDSFDYVHSASFLILVYLTLARGSWERTALSDALLMITELSI
jgi:hypothetical protein